nr:rho GTPase-activating protein 20-like isoform X3 [Cherax quadricarinatus]
MSTWTERMQRRAATLGNVVTSCGHPNVPYPRRLEKVKFGVSLEQVCKNDIPGPLLVLILKLNKEGPTKKDVFRAPGHQGSMKKLIHFLQNGRLVNIDNFSVYTIASVLKKFLRKLPEGIFGREGEQELFSIIQLSDTEQQRDHIHRLITSMPAVTQHLLVLLFGTFRVIAMNAGRAQTGMTSEALGVSVAPSFFQSCVADGKTARMEDVIRFKAEVDVATQIMQFLIDNFGVSNLFGRANYEYYARITGRILKVEEDWIFAFRYPPDSLVAPMACQEESQSTPALIHIPESSSGYDLRGRRWQ